MEYVNLGNTGLKVSRLCFGTMTYGTSKWRDWIIDEDDARPFYQRALELGINFIDTADMYSLGVGEEVTGRALKDFAKREEIVLATKVFGKMGEDPNSGGLSRKHIMDAIDASLRRLQTDYVDLYLIHRYDPATPIEETLEALDDVVRAGKVRYLGASSMYAWQFCQALYLSDLNGWSRFVAMQNHYNLIYREEEREMMPLCESEGIGVTPWSPMARGFLAGNRHRQGGGDTSRAKADDIAQNLYYADSDFQVADRVDEVARKRGVSSSQIALAWLLHKPGVTSPIIGASKMAHLDEAVAALEIELGEDEMTSLEESYVPHRVLGHA
jgi:aryl-alcohol dehydrogenase (NADP+)